MLLLVTDTSGKNGTVALARAGEPGLHGTDVTDREAEQVIEVVPLAGGMFSAQLVPQIAALLTRHGFSKTDIDALIVVSGPGSFTGLRVGLAAIKALAEILKKPIVPVSLLEVVATAARTHGRVVAVLDGGRGEVFFGDYEIAGESVQVLREELLSKPDFLSASLGLEPLPHFQMQPDPGGISARSRSPGRSRRISHGCDERKVRMEETCRTGGTTVSPEQLEANSMRRSDAEMFVKKSS